jgi:hypothetical protein
VISHEAIGVNLPAGLFAGLAQRAEESLAILVIQENQFTPVSPADQARPSVASDEGGW